MRARRRTPRSERGSIAYVCAVSDRRVCRDVRRRCFFTTRHRRHGARSERRLRRVQRYGASRRQHRERGDGDQPRCRSRPEGAISSAYRHAGDDHPQAPANIRRITEALAPPAGLLIRQAGFNGIPGLPIGARRSQGRRDILRWPRSCKIAGPQEDQLGAPRLDRPHQKFGAVRCRAGRRRRLGNRDGRKKGPCR